MYEVKFKCAAQRHGGIDLSFSVFHVCPGTRTVHMSTR